MLKSIVQFNPKVASDDLQVFAMERLDAARNLLFSLACLPSGKLDSEDVLHIAEASRLLMDEGCEALSVLQLRNNGQIDQSPFTTIP